MTGLTKSSKYCFILLNGVGWFLVMATLKPLKGILLIDCAEANLENGLQVATYQCGYQTDIEAFQSALSDACHEAGIDIHSLGGLKRQGGIEISPSSSGQI
ncbi:MAG: hypothetical protein AB4040_10000 [Synechococcus sp.]